MNDKNWPDPKRKGYPLNHKVSAWHLLRTGSGIDTPFYWDAIKIRWKSIGGDWFTPAMIMDICKYQGATFTPTQINEMLAAERERCILACKNEGKAFESPEYSGGKSNAWGELFAVSECIEAIRNLGDAP